MHFVQKFWCLCHLYQKKRKNWTLCTWHQSSSQNDAGSSWNDLADYAWRTDIVKNACLLLKSVGWIWPSMYHRTSQAVTLTAVILGCYGRHFYESVRLKCQWLFFLTWKIQLFISVLKMFADLLYWSRSVNY